MGNFFLKRTPPFLYAITLHAYTTLLVLQKSTVIMVSRVTGYDDKNTVWPTSLVIHGFFFFSKQLTYVMFCHAQPPVFLLGFHYQDDKFE